MGVGCGCRCRSSCGGGPVVSVDGCAWGSERTRKGERESVRKKTGKIKLNCKIKFGEIIYERYYGVATGNRIDKIIGLFCRISSLL